MDEDGNELWNRRYDLLPDGNDVATTIISDGQNGYYVLGHGYRNSTQEKDVFALHIAECGDISRTVWLGNGLDEEIQDGVVTPDGMLVTAGVVRLSPTQLELLALGITADTCNIPPCSFTRVSPEDSTILDEAWPIEFSWNRSTDAEGDPISYIFHVESNYYYSLEPSDTVTSDTFLFVTFPIESPSLDQVFDFRWQVWATDGVDTVEAANGEGYFQNDIFISTDEVTLHPSSFALSAYPNPFNAATTFSFTLSHEEQVSLALYDLQGRLVKELVDSRMTAGVHAIQFNGSEYASGIYFAELRTPTQSSVAKLVLLK